MHKKLASITLGIALLASPIIVSAQTVSTNNASIIAILEQLVATLTQELQQLIAARGGSSNAGFSATPISGSAPLAVHFTNVDQVGTGGGFLVNFGDGTQSVSLVESCNGHSSGPQNCLVNTDHTYTQAGTYAATLVRRFCEAGAVEGACTSYSSQTIGTATLTVTGSNLTQTSATIWAVPTSVPAGTASTVFWNSTGAASCTETSADGSFSHNTLSGGVTTGALSGTTKYSITCTGPNGQSASNSATVMVSSKPTGTITSSAGSSIQIGQSTVITLNAAAAAGDALQYLYINESAGGAQSNVIESSQGRTNDVYTFTPGLPGTYTFYGWAYSNATAPNWYQIPEASVTIVVTNRTQTSATIDQNPLIVTAGAPFWITGTALNVGEVFVDIMPLNYQGNTDFQTANTNALTSIETIVSSNKWSAPYNDSSKYPLGGTYKMYVYDANTHLLLTSGQLSVRG